MEAHHYELLLTVVGAVALLAAWLPTYIGRRPLSLPIVLVAAGALLVLLPIGIPRPDPRATLGLTERVTEFAVIVALMGAGLRIDRPFSFRTWRTTWLLLGVAMPLTIAGVAVLGSLAGLGVAEAVLLGAALAPTDPVLASDVQVGEPTLEATAPPDAEDEVRFALTAEGGLNDALAFPFVYGAIRLVDGVDGPGELAAWLGRDVLWRTAVGVVTGWMIGRVLGIVAFRPPGPLVALAETPQGFVAVAATLLAYGATELVGGYGFFAVFVTAVVLRGAEHDHVLHAHLHTFIEQTENLLAVALLLGFGAALGPMLAPLGWQDGLVALGLLFVVRPVAGWMSLGGAPVDATERRVIAFFGIRGVGSIYYLAYGLAHGGFGAQGRLWGIVAAVILGSVLVHGVAATPAMRRVDRRARRRRRGLGLRMARAGRG